MTAQIQTIAQAAQTALTTAAASQGLSTKASGSSEHKRAFLEAFRRWELLFKRKDGGDTEAAKWLIAEYYDSLKHLSADGFEALTRTLKETCIFFPTIRECLEATKPKDRYDWGHPFLNKPHLFDAAPRGLAALPAPVRQIEDHSE